MATTRQVVTPETLAERVAAVGRQISADYTGKPLVLVGILKGATVLLADLLRAISEPVGYDLVHVTRRREERGEVIQLAFATPFDLKGRHVLVLKDIYHSGVTENYLLTHLAEQQPASLEVVALVDRPRERRVALDPRYVVVGEVPDGRLVGYGMEYDGHGGNLPGIHLLESV